MGHEEDYIEKLIRTNRNEFVEDPSENHLKKFIRKMNTRMRHFVSIVPHLVKVAIITIVIFIASIICFKKYIFNDTSFIMLQVKIVTAVTRLIHPE
ncbi:MAG TPA: hypothetical protein VHO50_00300 [Bacteroidales bacterium]|nr:hypothetical protein [Bacteroidales bacterium]